MGANERDVLTINDRRYSINAIRTITKLCISIAQQVCVSMPDDNQDREERKALHSAKRIEGRLSVVWSLYRGNPKESEVICSFLPLPEREGSLVPGRRRGLKLGRGAGSLD